MDPLLSLRSFNHRNRNAQIRLSLVMRGRAVPQVEGLSSPSTPRILEALRPQHSLLVIVFKYVPVIS